VADHFTVRQRMDLQKMVRRGDVELAEKNGGHVIAEVLTGVDDLLPGGPRQGPV
jgi:hypothetical protein